MSGEAGATGAGWLPSTICLRHVGERVPVEMYTLCAVRAGVMCDECVTAYCRAIVGVSRRARLEVVGQ